MSLKTALRRTPVKFGVMVASVVAVTGAMLTLAAGTWGPDRPTFTVEKPAPYVTFNSITNNPVDGDERNFVRAKPTDGSSALNDTVQVTPGKEYVVRMVVHNNAGDNLDLESINTRVKAGVPTHTATSVDVTGFVSADNAKPKEVWDSVRFKADEKFNLAYVAGSAKIYNQGYAKNGAKLADSIVTSTGAKVGYKNAGDGKIPGCFEYLSYVEFKVKPQFAKKPGFEMAKTVSLHGKNDWKENVTTKPGDLVDFRIKYKNTGGITQNNVVVKDVLPAGLSYQAGSTMLYNTIHVQGKKISDNVTKNGVNIGHYSPNSTAYVMFTAKAVESHFTAQPQGECDPRTVKNIAKVETDHGNKEDDATVTVPIKCLPPKPKPAAECVDLNIERIGENKYRLDAKASVKNGATIKAYSFNIKNVPPKDPSQPIVDPIYFYESVKTNKTTASVTTRQLSTLMPGKTYLAYVSVNTSEGYRTGTQCQVKFTVPEKPQPKMIEVCELETGKIIEINEKDFDVKKHSRDLSDCDKEEEPKLIEVCELATGKIIEIKEADFDADKHSKDLSDCDKEEEPTLIEVCELATSEIIEINEKDFDAELHSRDLSDCDEPEEPAKVEVCNPETGEIITVDEDEADNYLPVDAEECDEKEVKGEEAPEEIPSTGPASIIGGLFGSSALGLGVTSYVRSRRALGSLLG